MLGRENRKMLNNHLDSNIFYQIENVTLDAKNKNYSIRLDANYKYIVGFFFLDQFVGISGDKFNLNRKGKKIINDLPLSFFCNSQNYGVNDNIYYLDEVANNSIINLYIENSSILKNVQVCFILSNYKNKNFSKRNFDFYEFKVGANSELKKYPLYLRDDYKYILGIYIQNALSRNYSLLDSSKSYFKEVHSSFFPDRRLVGLDNCLRPIFLQNKNYFIEVANQYATEETITVIYEYV